MDAEEGRTFVQCAVLPLGMEDTVAVSRGLELGSRDVLIGIVKDVGGYVDKLVVIGRACCLDGWLMRLV